MGRGSLIKGIHSWLESDIRTWIKNIDIDEFKIRDSNNWNPLNSFQGIVRFYNSLE